MDSNARFAERGLRAGFRGRRLETQSVDLRAVYVAYGTTFDALATALRGAGWVLYGNTGHGYWFELQAPPLGAWETQSFTCPVCGIACSEEWGTDASPLCSVCATREQLTDEQRAEVNPRRLPEVWDSWTDTEGATQ